LKRFLVNSLKIAISVGILAYLVMDANSKGDFAVLLGRDKQWGALAGAAVLCFLAVLITLVRWYYLIRALDLPIRFQDALRLGFLGYLFNMSPVGIVGGDLLKAVMLARNYPGRRAEAAATVFFDRAIGLYVLFVVASVAVFFTGMGRCPNATIQAVCSATLAVTGIGTLGMGAMLIPGLTNGRASALMARLPYLGGLAKQLLTAVRMYRRNVGVLVGSVLLTILVHSFNAAGMYLIASGLYRDPHSLGAHFVITPLAHATGVLPISIGPFEAALGELYAAAPLPDGRFLQGSGRGLVVALGYRLITLLIAAVGVGYYVSSRQELAEAMRSADEMEAAGQSLTAPPA